MNQSEAIFRKAMVSKNPRAVLAVASAFDAMGERHKAITLRQRRFHGGAFGFGAMARGTKIKGIDGAVIPPGRYWVDLVDDAKRSKWVNFTMDHPEVIVEKSEWSGSEGKVIQTVIFTIPTNATNYGLPGVIFPTNILGFPTIADTTVKSVADTVKRPAPMTSLQALAETPSLLGQGVQSGVQYTAETIGQAAKGVTQGLGISTNTLIMMGIGVIVGLALLNRLMIPKLPI